jgi:hypothetical protein
MNMLKLLQDLNLEQFYSLFEAHKVEIDTFKEISVANGRLKFRAQLQQLLMQKCGLGTKQIITIMDKVKTLPIHQTIGTSYGHNSNYS